MVAVTANTFAAVRASTRPVRKNGVEKLWTYLRQLRNAIANLRVNKLISGKEHDIGLDNRETALKTIRRVPYIVPKFHELWSING